MIFAARKLQGIGLIMLLTFVALIAYPVSLRVSATRTELQSVEAEIQRVRMQNRVIEGDIAVLTNARQLDQWNSEYLAFAAPQAGQYLNGERALASLDGLRPPAGGTQQAPVLVAMVDPKPAAAAPQRAREDDGEAKYAELQRALASHSRDVNGATARDMRRTVAMVTDLQPAAGRTIHQ